MHALKVPLKEAQKVKLLLKESRLFDEHYQSLRDSTHIWYPVRKDPNLGFPLENKDLPKRIVHPKLQELLSDLEDPITSYDVLGTIARVEVRNPHDAKTIAQAILQTDPKVKTVVMKTSIHQGPYRLLKTKHLAGVRTKTVDFIENGVRMRFHIDKTYYSTRFGAERTRVPRLVKKGERVLVMFSGVGPFTCAIAKNSLAEEVVGVEINPEAHKYALENITLNKLRNATALLGDVRSIVPSLGLFDRILMPLPQTSKEFLELAGSAARKGALIHCYVFSHEKELNKTESEVLEKLQAYKPKHSATIKCGDYSPGVHRYCIEVRVG